MTTEQKKTRLAVVPSILAGTAALVAAISTLYVNLRDDYQPAPALSGPSAVATGPATAAPTPARAPAAPQRLLLRLDRVQVDDDGSAGSTDWNFQVSVDGDPVFSVPMESLNDKPGQNLARPADRDEASAEVLLPAAKSVELSVKGWKKGWMPGSDAEVSGKAWMASGFNKTEITLKTAEPEGPQFVLYFSAAPAE